MSDTEAELSLSMGRLEKWIDNLERQLWHAKKLPSHFSRQLLDCLKYPELQYEPGNLDTFVSALFLSQTLDAIRGFCRRHGVYFRINRNLRVATDDPKDFNGKTFLVTLMLLQNEGETLGDYQEWFRKGIKVWDFWELFYPPSSRISRATLIAACDSIQLFLTQYSNGLLRDLKLKDLIATREGEVRQDVGILYERAVTDQLTWLRNRYGYEDYLRAITPKIESEYGWRCAVWMIDLDHFKRVNDTFWHDVWDTTLKAVAWAFNRIQSRDEYKGLHFFREWGEEFIFILPGNIDYENFSQLLHEEIRNIRIELTPEKIGTRKTYIEGRDSKIRKEDAYLQDLLTSWKTPEEIANLLREYREDPLNKIPAEPRDCDIENSEFWISVSCWIVEQDGLNWDLEWIFSKVSWLKWRADKLLYESKKSRNTSVIRSADDIEQESWVSGWSWRRRDLLDIVPTEFDWVTFVRNIDGSIWPIIISSGSSIASRDLVNVLKWSRD